MKRAVVVLKALLLLGVVAFVGVTAWDLGRRWQEAPAVSPHFGWLLASIVPIVGVSLLQGVGWLSLMRRLVGRHIPALPGLEMFLGAMLGRYLPGKVGMAAILMTRAKQLRLTPALMGSSMLLIVLVYGVLGAGLGVALMTWVGDSAMLPGLAALRGWMGALSLGGMVVGIVVLLVLDRRRYPAFVLRVLGIDGEGPLVGWPLVAWYTVVWIFWWSHGALTIVAVGGSWADALPGAGLFVLAPVIGFLAIVTPGGLGVREAVVAMGLEPAIGPGPAVVAALLSRIISLGIDVAMWLGFRAALRRRGGLPEAAGEIEVAGEDEVEPKRRPVVVMPENLAGAMGSDDDPASRPTLVD